MRRRKRSVTGGAAAAVTVALVLSACDGGEDIQTEPSPPRTTTEAPRPVQPKPEIRGRAPTRRELVGLWAKTGERLSWRFKADGTFAFDRFDLDNPYARGTWALKGRTITLRALGPQCVDRWSLRAGLVKASDALDDELDVVFLGNACGEISGSRWTLARIE